MVKFLISLAPLLAIVHCAAASGVASCLSYRDCPISGQRCVREEYEGDDSACASGSVPCVCVDDSTRGIAYGRRLGGACDSNGDCAPSERNLCIDWEAVRVLADGEGCAQPGACSCDNQSIPCNSSDVCALNDTCTDEALFVEILHGDNCSSEGACWCRPGDVEISMCEDHSDCGDFSMCHDSSTLMVLLGNETCNNTEGCLCGDQAACNDSLDCREGEFCFDVASNSMVLEGRPCQDECFCLAAFEDGQLCDRQSDCDAGTACFDSDTYMVLLGNESCAEGSACFCSEVSECNSTMDCSSGEFCFDLELDQMVGKEDTCTDSCICLRAFAEGLTCDEHADCTDAGTKCFDLATTALIPADQHCRAWLACACGHVPTCHTDADCFASELCYDFGTGTAVGDGFCSGGDCMCTRARFEAQACESHADCDDDSLACFDSANRMVLADESCGNDTVCFCSLKTWCNASVDCTEGEYCFDRSSNEIVEDGSGCDGDCACASGYQASEPCLTNMDCESGQLCIDISDDGQVMHLGHECAEDSTCACGSMKLCRAHGECDADEYCYNEIEAMPSRAGVSCVTGSCFCDRHFAEAEECYSHADCDILGDFACFEVDSLERLVDDSASCPLTAVCVCLQYFWPTSTSTATTTSVTVTTTTKTSSGTTTTTKSTTTSSTISATTSTSTATATATATASSTTSTTTSTTNAIPEVGGDVPGNDRSSDPGSADAGSISRAELQLQQNRGTMSIALAAGVVACLTMCCCSAIAFRCMKQPKEIEAIYLGAPQVMAPSYTGLSFFNSTGGVCKVDTE